MIDILQRLDEELDRTPHDHHVCKPLPRAVVAAAAAEIRRLRMRQAAVPADALRRYWEDSRPFEGWYETDECIADCVAIQLWLNDLEAARE